MKTLFQEAFIILAIAGAVISFGIQPNATQLDDSDYQYEDNNDDFDDTPLKEDKLCPRDCICTESMVSKIARCSRLEPGTQTFGDITGLVVENVDPKHPLILTDMMFSKLGLGKINNIKITNSIISSISPTAFKNLNDLASVNLSGNRIEKIPVNVFADNGMLSLVDLSNNPGIMKDAKQAFLNSSWIQELEISNCGIKSLSSKTFSALGSLMYINLSGNKLQELDPMVFADLQILEEVELTDNFIKKIPEDLFVKNLEITTLRLRGNPITSVIDVKIKELLTIDLSMAKIKTIGPSMFDGMIYISNLNLSGNGIERIHNQAFHRLTTLNYLDLSHNNLNMISDQLIKENVELDILKVSNNPLLKSLPEKGFACSNEYFNIILFDASSCSLEVLANDTFSTMVILSQLSLSNNNIHTLGSSLQKATRLVDIDLSFNLLSVLHKDTFSMNKELGKLNLAGNPLTTISADLFVNNPVLTWLDVSMCQLTTLWTTHNSPAGIMNNLHFINASSNYIKSVPVSQLELINKLHTLDISQNPLVCDEAFKNLIRWLGQHSVAPAARDMFSAKMELAEKFTNKYNKWESLASSVCVRATLDDQSNENASDEIPKIVLDKNLSKNDDDDTDDADDADDEEDNIEEDFYDESYLLEAKVKSGESTSNIKISEEVAKIYESIDHTKIDIPIVHDIMKQSEKTEEILSDWENEDEREKEIEKLMTLQSRGYDNMMQYMRIIKPIVYILVAVLIICLIVKMIKYCASIKTDKQRIRCSLISVIPSSHSRVKKDCGLVYQQLSEDLTGPKTPIISRNLLIGNKANNILSYETSPFHHSKITPENV